MINGLGTGLFSLFIEKHSYFTTPYKSLQVKKKTSLKPSKYSSNTAGKATDIFDG